MSYCLLLYSAFLGYLFFGFFIAGVAHGVAGKRISLAWHFGLILGWPVLLAMARLSRKDDTQ